MTTRVFSDTIELGRMLINLGDGYAGESVNAAPVLPGHFEVTFQLDGEGAAALDHLLAAAALKMRPGMPPVRSIAQVFEHLKACGYEVTPDEWAPPGYIDLGWMAGGRCRVRNTHIRISGPWGRAYVEGEAATGRFDWYLSDHGRAVHLLGLAGCPVALPMPPDNWQNSAELSRVCLYDRGEEADFQTAMDRARAAFAALHRAATLAWIAGKIALPYPSSMGRDRGGDDDDRPRAGHDGEALGLPRPAPALRRHGADRREGSDSHRRSATGRT